MLSKGTFSFLVIKISHSSIEEKSEVRLGLNKAFRSWSASFLLYSFFYFKGLIKVFVKNLKWTENLNKLVLLASVGKSLLCSFASLGLQRIQSNRCLLLTIFRFIDCVLDLQRSTADKWLVPMDNRAARHMKKIVFFFDSLLKQMRPFSNVVLLPCRTKLIELNSTLARRQ